MSATKYKIVKEAIKAWIRDGKVTPKQKISSENELAIFFRVSRQTIRQAIGELVNEGWLYREHGVGTFCEDRNEIKKGKEAKTIGFISTYLSDYIFPSIIRGAESYLTNKGYSIFLASTNNDLETERQCLQNMFNNHVDGLIVESTKSALYNPNLNMYLSLETNKIPFLMINGFYKEINPLSVTLDDELGGYLAAEHLIQLGHKKIVGLFKTDDIQGINRMKGFIRAYREYQLPVFPDMIISFTTEDKGSKPRNEIRRLLQETGEKPTAVFCYNDEIAIHIINLLQEFSVSVPENMSVVGFDDSHLAEAFKLTTVVHPKNILGEAAAKLIVDMVEGKRRSSFSPIVFEPKLVVRNSTGEPG